MHKYLLDYNLIKANRLAESWGIGYDLSRFHKGIGNILPREYVLRVRYLEQDIDSYGAINEYQAGTMSSKTAKLFESVETNEQTQYICITSQSSQIS